MTDPIQDAQRALKAYANSGVGSPSELAVKLNINVRYARELTGLLLNQALIELEDMADSDEYMVTHAGRRVLDSKSNAVLPLSYKANATGHRSTKGNEMIKASKPSKILTSVPAPAANDEGRECACGCGEAVSGRSVFRQGHDARMVSELAAALVGYHPKRGYGGGTVPPAFTDGERDQVTNADDIQHRIDQTVKTVEHYFGQKLADKTYNAAMSFWAKENVKHQTAQAKADKAAAKAAKAAPKPVEAKVGRWTRTGIVTAEGDLIYTDAKGTEKVAPAGTYSLI